MTSVHHAFDTRIFHKECKSLAAAGYDVTLVAPHEGRNVILNDVKLLSLALPKNRWERMTQTIWRVYETAVRENAEIYHFHDPELMLVAPLLRMRGKRVIYDVHEDYSGTMTGKQWLPSMLQIPAAIGVQACERTFSTACDRIIAATPKIASKFSPKKTKLVQNFPWSDELRPSDSAPYDRRDPIIAYVGWLSDSRGLREMVQAVRLASTEQPVKLVTAGKVIAGAKAECVLETEDSVVEHQGMLDRAQVAKLLARAKVGIVVLHPTKNYLESQPNKLFEYMSAGLPVVASDFPLWREIIESTDSGLLVDPMQPQAIAECITWLLRNPARAAEMGRNGQRAVWEKYSWERESERLIAAYDELRSLGRFKPASQPVQTVWQQ